MNVLIFIGVLAAMFTALCWLFRRSEEREIVEIAERILQEACDE